MVIIHGKSCLKIQMDFNRLLFQLLNKMHCQYYNNKFYIQTTLKVLEMCNHQSCTLKIPLLNFISIVIKIDILRSYIFFLFRVTRNASLYQGRLLSAVTLVNVGYCALVKVRTYLDSLPINIALLTKLEDEPPLRPCQVLMGFHYHYQFEYIATSKIF